MTEIQNGSVEDFLEHYGIKGMRWGVRRTENQLKKARAKAGLEADSDDAARARAVAERVRTKGPNSVSNADMQLLINRMNLERNYNNMMEQQAGKKDSTYRKGKNAVNEILWGVGTVTKVAKTVSEVSKLSDERKKKAFESWDWKKDVGG